LHDPRNPKYIQQLKDYLSSNQLEDKIKVLGFIPRKDMLCLIEHAYAVVQPSLFEGWSTVVEDVKAVNKFIFLSDLKVHREQINKNVCFFDPYNEEDLCNKLLTVEPTHEPRDYQKNIKEFGLDFLNIINQFNS
jgi:glycosyltransferase involved in cell wall biosynthesis